MSETMSRTRIRAWLAAGIWGVAGAGFLITFFAGGGPWTFPEESGRHLAGATALAFGFLGSWASLWLTRQRLGAPAAFDERDFAIVARANQATLVVVLVAVFAFAIGLWTRYEAAGQVPVAWLWLLAYGSIILASIAAPVATLILDARSASHG